MRRRIGRRAIYSSTRRSQRQFTYVVLFVVLHPHKNHAPPPPPVGTLAFQDWMGGGSGDRQYLLVHRPHIFVAEVSPSIYIYPPLKKRPLPYVPSPCRQCRKARVYGHTTTAMHDMSTPPSSPPLPPPLVPPTPPLERRGVFGKDHDGAGDGLSLLTRRVNRNGTCHSHIGIVCYGRHRVHFAPHHR